MADLAAFLSRAGQTPFAFGQHDCSLFLADWLIDLGYPDTAGHLRGQYSTALGCAKIIVRSGGLVSTVESCVAPIGIKRTVEPGQRDIGVIDVLTREGRQMVGAICTGPRWATLGQRGLVSLTTAPVAAWGV